MPMIELEIFNLEDRVTVAGILVKNGYTVKQGKRRLTPTSKSYVYCLYADKPDEKVKVDES